MISIRNGLLCFPRHCLDYQLTCNCLPLTIVNAQAAIGLDPQNSYTPGSTIAIACSVQGNPAPNVTWTKDNVPLYESERVHITCK